MKPFLTRDKLQVIIATTLDEYNFFIARDKAFKRRFEAVLHKEPNTVETFNIVKHVVKNRYPEMTITDSILKELIALGNRYILDRNNPDKALALLDTVVAWTLNHSDKETITSEKLREVISARLNVPKNSLNVDIKTGLIGMDRYLAEKFPGWEEACCKVTKSLSKALTRNLRQYGPLSVTIMCGADVRLMTDIARAAVKKLGCVGDGAVYTIDVNRADPVDPFVSCVRKNPNAAIKATIMRNISKKNSILLASFTLLPPFLLQSLFQRLDFIQSQRSLMQRNGPLYAPGTVFCECLPSGLP